MATQVQGHVIHNSTIANNHFKSGSVDSNALKNGEIGPIKLKGGAAGVPSNTYIEATFQKEVLTTKGDLVVTTGSATARLPVGTNGQVLLANSSATYGVSWQAAPSGGGGGGVSEALAIAYAVGLG